MLITMPPVHRAKRERKPKSGPGNFWFMPAQQAVGSLMAAQPRPTSGWSGSKAACRKRRSGYRPADAGFFQSKMFRARNIFAISRSDVRLSSVPRDG